eukprot:356188-Chlamydomonas_euryale.AAC.2
MTRRPTSMASDSSSCLHDGPARMQTFARYLSGRLHDVHGLLLSLRPVPTRSTLPHAARYRGDTLTNGTQHFLEVWLFNVTNVDEIRNGSKPKLVRGTAWRVCAGVCAWHDCSCGLVIWAGR